MNILIPDSWLRDYLETDATPKDIQRCMSLCGPSIEKTTKTENDVIYDVEITTNRVDSMSVYGLAREAVAILPQFGFKAALKPLELAKLKSGSVPELTIQNDEKLCKRILALKVDQIKVEPSPLWLQNRLLSVGQRPLNNLVDITNYVMWETGHPAHVFDFDRLTTGKMIIREARKNEKITTLDAKTYNLSGGEVVIDDGNGNIIDLPSVMGTANSVVVENTESALFFVDDVKSSKVRFASMTHSIRTQAATLLEKDIDPETSHIAISRMAALIKQIYPRVVLGNLLDIYPKPDIPHLVTLPVSQISALIGQEISSSQVLDILHRLGFSAEITSGTLIVIPPNWRSADIQIPEDIIEEVARIFGYHNIPPILMSGSLPPPDYNQTFYWENRIKTALKYLGFTEIYTYSLVSQDTGLKLKNPLTLDWVYLRTSLFPSHREVISQNLGKADSFNFFEIANVYLPLKNNLPEEQSHLIVTTTASDYYRFKGILEALLSDLGIKNINPEIISDADILCWEIPVTELFKLVSEKKTYTPISKYTPIVEDINVSLSGSYSNLIKKISSLSNLIKQIDLKDKYGSKLTLRITYHSDTKQLRGDDIAPIREKLSSLS